VSAILIKIILSLQPANAKQDLKLKAYVRTSLFEDEDWKRGDFKDEFSIAETGKELKKSMFTSNVIGTSVHGFFSNGKAGDRDWYERQSVRGPTQMKASEGDRKRVHG
jgi:hypothetical protein